MTALFDHLVRASLEGSVLIAAVWLICRLAPWLPASLRALLWWLAALKLLVGLVGIDPVAVPLLPPVAVADVVHLGPVTNPTAALQTAAVAAQPAVDWRWWTTCVWLGAVSVLCLLAYRQHRRTRLLIASARPADPQLLDIVDTLAEQVGLAEAPPTRRFDQVESPMVAGLLTPVVLLPGARFDAMPAAHQRMAICHELVHLRRGDLWLGCVPALVERLFFFHPLAHLAAREYLLAREAACDAAVLRTMDAGAQEYGQLLLTLGVARLRAGFAASTTSRSFTSLKRRIGMLNHTSPTARARYTGWLLASAAACAIVPMQVVARTAPQVATSPALRPTPAPVAPADSAVSVEQDFSPATTASPASSASLTEATSQDEKGTSRSHPEFVLVLGEHNTIMNASDSSVARIRRAGDHVLWFKYQGKEYLTTDPDALKEAQAIYHEVSVIGGKQGEIGAKQGAIGALQGEVGAKQGAIGSQQGLIGAKQGAIGARQGALGAKESEHLSDAEKRELKEELEKLDKEMHELDEQMKALDEDMEKAGQPMAELGAKMKQLDVQMQALDKQMEEANRKADAAMQELIERLVKTGVAHQY